MRIEADMNGGRAGARPVRAGILLASAGFLLASLSPLRGQPPASDPTVFASGADVQAAVEAMRRDMKPDQGFLWRPLLRGGTAVAALEYWRKPAKPAVHPAEAEYVVVVAGAGKMVSGGTLVDPRQTNPNLIEGSRIEGGTTRRLRTGDVFLIPAGTPHWFEITGDRLVLLGTKIPQPQR